MNKEEAKIHAAIASIKKDYAETIKKLAQE